MNDILLTGGEKFLFWLYKHFNKKLLKKYFPLNEQDFQFKLEGMPNIYIDERENHCNISFNIVFNNYTNYDLFTSIIQIDLVVNSYRLLNFEKTIMKNYRRKEGLSFFSEIPLTFYQVKRILGYISPGHHVLNANFTLRIATTSILGDTTFTKHLHNKIEVRNVVNA
jgi:hypothetical protein